MIGIEARSFRQRLIRIFESYDQRENWNGDFQLEMP